MSQKVYILLIITILICTVQCKFDCSGCKTQLLDSLKINVESPILKCLHQNNDQNDTFVSSLFANCLITYGYQGNKVSDLLYCALMKCFQNDE